jgi:2-methylcitrate dehydratase PrpD
MVRNIKGHPQNPFTEQELSDKFKKCAAYSAYKLSPAVIESVIDVLMNLEDVDDIVEALIHPLAPN